MNELLVMRHAKSDWTVRGSDFDRPLNDRGRRAAERMGTWLVDNDLIPARIVSSAAVRTTATARTIAELCGVASEAVVFDRQLYLASGSTWQRRLMHLDEGRVLLCGHNPGVDDLVEYLAAGSVPFTDDGKLMTTGAIAHFRLPGPWSALGPGTCELVQLVRPRDF